MMKKKANKVKIKNKLNQKENKKNERFLEFSSDSINNRRYCIVDYLCIYSAYWNNSANC